MDERVREYLEGYARANEFLEAERMERLGRLTPEESRAIAAELDQSWEQSSRDGLELLEMWRIETLVAMRQAFRKLAEAQGRL